MGFRGSWWVSLSVGIETSERVHIHFCGNGGLWFRSYSGSLSKSAKVTKALMPHHSAPSLSEVPSGGAEAFCLLLRFSKVSRRQGGTLSGRYAKNGYVLSQQKPGRLRGRHREQARSHSLIEVQPGETGRLLGRLASKLCSHRPDGCMTGQPRPRNNKAPPREAAGCAEYHPQLMGNDGATRIPPNARMPAQMLQQNWIKIIVSMNEASTSSAQKMANMLQ